MFEELPGTVQLKVKRDRVIATYSALLAELPVSDIDIQKCPSRRLSDCGLPARSQAIDGEPSV